ncbi:MAG: hypothetical protein MUD11_11255 [Rhodobacteraceae bacterium]|jgi:hypothetical protein|nr:hypothetical protein [Paracoccaceae bacterium]
MAQEKIIAVLTGDIIGSQKAGRTKLDAAMQRLKQTAESLHPDTRFTRFRGDGWQLVLQDPKDILVAVLLLLADLRASGLKVSTRISVGVGPADSLGTDTLSDATGRAFVLSGQGLDQLPKQARLAIWGGRAKDQHWHLAIFELVDWLTEKWSAAQAEAVATALRQPLANHQMLAAHLGITRQAVQSRLSKAGIGNLYHAVLAFRNATWEMQND